MKYSHVVVWFAITSSVTVCGNIVYLRRHRNDSVEFSCAPTKVDIPPFAFSLERVWAHPKQVLYQNLNVNAVIHDETDKHRISVQKDRAILRKAVSISHLRGYDTDMYLCVFYYETPTTFYNHTAETKFFLHVEDPVHEPCSCYDYKPLMYSLLAAAGLLFLCVLGFTVGFWNKPTSHPKARAVPIYEEMNGVRLAKAKPANPNLYLAEEDSANLCKYTQPQKENPYINSLDPSPALNALNS
ncbi:cd7 antigen-like [Electrophorus electricus]|uniref:Immunoglobulin V-set domain-containing protein n=1 Tax=Electrophorus electricus TaxID=8005 RepID=A0A4W4ENA8_ELEEL|nr:cd7 antigen-like [Electrophorus electricus]